MVTAQLSFQQGKRVPEGHFCILELPLVPQHAPQLPKGPALCHLVPLLNGLLMNCLQTLRYLSIVHMSHSLRRSVVIIRAFFPNDQAKKPSTGCHLMTSDHQQCLWPAYIPELLHAFFMRKSEQQFKSRQSLCSQSLVQFLVTVNSILYGIQHGCHCLWAAAVPRFEECKQVTLFAKRKSLHSHNND